MSLRLVAESMLLQIAALRYPLVVRLSIILGWCNVGVRSCLARTGMGPIQPCENSNQNFITSLAQLTQFNHGSAVIQSNNVVVSSAPLAAAAA
jgi:hypothetical protein